MNKFSYDLYNCQCGFLDNMSGLYSEFCKICDNLKLTTIYKPTVVPYFYGKNRDDDGISCYVLIKENNSVGLLTLHTFSKRKIVYADMVCENKNLELKFKTQLVHIFNPGEICGSVSENNKNIEARFGKEIVISANSTKDITLNDLNNIAENIILNSDIHKITNTVIETTKNNISLLNVIAESHLFISYDIKNKNLFCDFFSCKPFSNDKILKELSAHFNSVNVDYVGSRGLKHSEK